MRGPFYALGKELSKVFVCEIWVRLVLPRVAQHSYVDATLAIVTHPIHGFALMGDFGNGVCQDGQTLGGAVLTVGELFRRMQPLIWQIFGDGVMMIEDDDGEIVPGAMTGRQTFAFWDDLTF